MSLRVDFALSIQRRQAAEQDVMQLPRGLFFGLNRENRIVKFEFMC